MLDPGLESTSERSTSNRGRIHADYTALVVSSSGFRSGSLKLAYPLLGGVSSCSTTHHVSRCLHRD